MNWRFDGNVRQGPLSNFNGGDCLVFQRASGVMIGIKLAPSERPAASPGPKLAIIWPHKSERPYRVVQGEFETTTFLQMEGIELRPVIEEAGELVLDYASDYRGGTLRLQNGKLQMFVHAGEGRESWLDIKTGELLNNIYETVQAVFFKWEITIPGENAMSPRRVIARTDVRLAVTP